MCLFWAIQKENITEAVAFSLSSGSCLPEDVMGLKILRFLQILLSSIWFPKAIVFLHERLANYSSSTYVG